MSVDIVIDNVVPTLQFTLADVEAWREARRVGFDRFCMKPFDPERVIATVSLLRPER